MAAQLDEVPFTFSVTGDETGDKWFGEFRALRRLSHRLQMQRSRIKRELLGEYPQYASQRDIEQAVMFAELAVSITKAPKWWLETDGGQSMTDDNVIIELWKQVMKVQGKAVEEEEKKTADDAKVLRKAVENPEEPKLEEKDEE